MAASYYYVKKSRSLCKQKDIKNDSSDECIKYEELVQEGNMESYKMNEDVSHIDLHCNDSYANIDITNANLILNENADIPKNIPLDLSQKLKYWALSNITVLTNKCISELLLLLRSEGHVNLPRKAETLLGTCHVRLTRMMATKRGSEGCYIYIGIEEALKKRISENNYKENKICILVNIDGVPLFHSSRQQFWPILVQVFHINYHSDPAIVAIYCGDSKPALIGEFLHDFIQESIALITNGIIIGSTRYEFEIAAFVCDTPARSYIKCSKGHKGFYSCERCETKGLTTGKNTRVFPEMTAAQRTHESFQCQSQPNHHKENEISPLLLIPNFNIIQGVILDYMHLLCIGVTRNLLEKWLHKGTSLARIKRTKRKILREALKSVTSSIPYEFQRKIYDLEDWGNWKATQFRFFLLYCGAIVLQNVLSTERYKHFLLLLVACRILCDSSKATENVSYAKQLLRNFFYLMPTYYGSESQSMNFHNLIHVADDVEYMQSSLSNFSAFPFENTLGKIKKLIRSPKNPLVQVVNRLAELDAMPSKMTRLHSVIGNIIFDNTITNITDLFTIKKIEINNVMITSCRPNNVVILRNQTIFKIKKLYVTKRAVTQLNEVILEGYTISIKGNVFEYPHVSSDFGIFQLENCIKNRIKYSGADIEKKCIYLKTYNNKYAITLIH